MSVTYNIIQADWGIGDIICSLYAVQGLAAKKTGSQINLYLRQHFGWAYLADIPGLQIHQYDEKNPPVNAILLYDANEDPHKFIKHTNSPKQYYSQRLGVTPQIPKLQNHITSSSRIFGEKYIVFSPFASRINRTWEIQNWRLLAQKFQEIGYKVIALDSPHENKRCKPIGVEYFWGQTAEWTAQVCQHAEMIIGNDSGIAHLGGWLGKKTLVLMSQLLPAQFYDLTNNYFWVPKQHCTGCRFIPEYGYEEKCDYGCWVLQSIRPQHIFDAAIDCLNETEVLSNEQFFESSFAQNSKTG